MNYKKLGSSDLKVSEICLGTMTWGTQNNQRDAFEQIEFALEQGINFIDTAELYSVPPSAASYGATETIIGNWLAANKERRSDIILATKIAGKGLPWIREGSPISGDSVKEAVNDSLRRLQTDYIDLYQLHWPNRAHPHFGKHWPQQIDYRGIDVAKERDEHLEILTALNDCVKSGKIRHCGLSDDTPWGINEYLRLAENHDLPKIVSIQNEFNLLHLIPEAPHIIETCVLNDIAYLPWSPLAGGALTGKYRNNEIPNGSRWSLDQRFGIFRNTEQSRAAVAEFYAIAKRHDISLTQMALSFIYNYRGVTSTIIGATNLTQLEHDISAIDLQLSATIEEEILDVVKRYPVLF